MTKHCSCVKICARGLGYIRLPTACLFASTNGILTSIFDSHVSKHCRKEPSQPPTPALPHPRIPLSAVSSRLHLRGCHHRPGRMSRLMFLPRLHPPSLLSRPRPRVHYLCSSRLFGIVLCLRFLGLRLLR